jgi:hypothetical protein
MPLSAVFTLSSLSQNFHLKRQETQTFHFSLGTDPKTSDSDKWALQQLRPLTQLRRPRTHSSSLSIISAVSQNTLHCLQMIITTRQCSSQTIKALRSLTSVQSQLTTGTPYTTPQTIATSQTHSHQIIKALGSLTAGPQDYIE